MNIVNNIIRGIYIRQGNELISIFRAIILFIHVCQLFQGLSQKILSPGTLLAYARPFSNASQRQELLKDDADMVRVWFFYDFY